MIYIRNVAYGVIETKFNFGKLIEESAEILKDLSYKIVIKNIFKP